VSRWTLVQHSGFVRGGDEQFRHAVETRALLTGEEVKRVRRAAGVVFEDALQAEDAEYCENYPDDLGGLVPQARGRFSSVKIEDSPIYIPPAST
jgi:hypothetical protein